MLHLTATTIFVGTLGAALLNCMIRPLVSHPRYHNVTSRRFYKLAYAITHKTQSLSTLYDGAQCIHASIVQPTNLSIDYLNNESEQWHGTGHIELFKALES